MSTIARVAWAINALTVLFAGSTYAQNAGVVRLTDADWVAIGLGYPPGTSHAHVEIVDPDRNSSSNVQDTLSVLFTGPSDTGEPVVLSGIGAGTGTFRGGIELDVVPKTAELRAPDGRLQIRHGEKLVVAYRDPLDDFGNSSVVTDAAFENSIADSLTFMLTRAAGPFVVIGTLSVPEATVAVIDAAELRFTPRTSILVAGRLEVTGTPGAPALFTSVEPTPAPGDWGAITIFFEAGHASASIRNAVIEYGHGVTHEGALSLEQCVIRNNRGSGVNSIGSHQPCVIDRCTLGSNTAYGVDVSGTAVRVNACTIDGNTAGGVNIWGGTVDSTTIRNNAVGVVAGGGATILHTTITANTGPGIRAVGACTIQRNDLYENRDYEIYNESAVEVNARFNFWGPVTTAEMNIGTNPKDIARIFDRYDDSSKGFVNYSSWEQTWQNRTAVQPSTWSRAKNLFRAPPAPRAGSQRPPSR